MKPRLEPLGSKNNGPGSQENNRSESGIQSPSDKKIPGSDVPSLPCFASRLKPISAVKKSTFESSVEHSKSVKDRIKDRLQSTFTEAIVADQEAFAKSVLNNAGQSSNVFQPQMYELKINKESNINEQDARVSKKKQIGVYPISDTQMFPPYRPHTSWQVGLRQYDDKIIRMDAPVEKKKRTVSRNEDEFGFVEDELVDEDLSDTDEPKTKKERQKSLMEQKAEKYVQKELELPHEEVIDRYFGTSAKLKFGDTYRQLHRHADLLRGGREELEFVIRDEEEAQIFQRTEMELVQLGVITPRDLIAEARKTMTTTTTSTANGTDEELPAARSEYKETADGTELDMTYQPSSPRAVFLTGCLRHGMAPRTIAMLRKRISPILDLSHIGIGNATALLLAEALDKMPYLQTLNLTDNNLDDTGLSALIASASRHPTLEVLDISQNVMDDEASAALADFLGRPQCNLKCLRMSASDIDDGECAHFVEILMQNRTLQELDMSNNLIGKDENLNAVKPDFVTGGESLAELLRNSDCPLQTLNLHWNMIRLEGAEVLCDSLRSNRYLTHLDLSYNSLGSHAACVLGAALLENRHLRHLNIANNAVDSEGTTTLVAGLREHPHLHEVILDGNPIGEQGARAVMKVIAQQGYRLMIRTLNCDITTKSNDIKLRHDIPVGDYLLDMNKPYDRAIAFELLEIIANDTNIDCAMCDWYQEVTNPPSPEELARALKPIVAKKPNPNDKNANSRPGSPNGRGGNNDANNAVTKDPLTLLLQAWGAPTGSYYIVRFDERRPPEALSNEELQEEAFNVTLAPIADLSAPTIFRAVKEYDSVGTDSFPTDRLLDLYDDLLLHKKMHPNSRYKKIKTALSLHFPKQAEDGGSLNSSASSIHVEFDPSEALKLDAMLDSLVQDSKKVLDPHESGVIDINSFVEYITERARAAKERLHQLRHLPRVAARQRTSATPGVRPVTPSASRPTSPFVVASSLERYIPPPQGWMRIRVVESYNISGTTTHAHGGSPKPGTPSNNPAPTSPGAAGTSPKPPSSSTSPVLFYDNNSVMTGNENGGNPSEGAPPPGPNAFPSQGSVASSIGSQTNEHDLAPSGFALSKAKALRLLEQLKNMSKSHPVLLLLYAIDSVWLRLEEAQLLYSFARLKSDSDDPTAALAKILLRMQSGSEAMRMLYCCVGDNVLLLRRLKSRLGNAYYPLVNIYSGYYCLDLSNTLDRFCLKRLIEKSVRNTDARRMKGYWDTSQHGHWSCFRNEYHRYVPLPPGVSIPGLDANGMPLPNEPIGTKGGGKAKGDAAMTNTAGGGGGGGGIGGGDNMNSLDANHSILSADAALGNTLILTNGLGSMPALTINPRLFCPIPARGRLEFDFVNIDRPDPALCRAVHEDLIIDTLLLSRLLDEADVDWAMNRLREMAQYNRRTFLPDGRPPYRSDLGRAISIGELLHTMYTSLHMRQTTRKRAAKREAIKVAALAETSTKKDSKRRTDSPPGKAKTNLYSSSASVRKKQNSIFGNANKPTPAAGGALPVGSNPIQDAVQAVMKAQQTAAVANGRPATSSGGASASAGGAISGHGPKVAAKAAEAMIRFKSLSRRGKKADQKQRIWGKRLYEVIVEGLGTDEHKSAALLEFFEAELGTMWLQCRHLALILEVFGPIGTAAKSNVGSYRVELIVLLFDRLVDIYNFELIVSVLTADEQAAVYARIGILNLFNPCKCEGGWSFDLQRWEERQVAKMLIHLSVVEPGENWNNKTFAYDRGFVPIPGWDLNKGWLTEEGLPKKGLLSFEMFAGDGLRMAGCCVDMKLRQMLCALTNVPQRNFVAEVERQEMLTDENTQAFHRALDRHAVNVIHFDTRDHRGPRAVLPLVKLITQLDILRQLSNGTGSVEEMQRHLMHIQQFHRHVDIAHVLHPDTAMRSKNLQMAQDELDDHYHDILHYTVEDANDHLRTESDCSWNYTSTTRKPDIWV